MMITQSVEAVPRSNRHEFPAAGIHSLHEFDDPSRREEHTSPNLLTSNPLAVFAKRVADTLLRTAAIVAPILILAAAQPASASIAYGSINNFDTVNDTGGVCHGFEIEIDDIHSKDITYTYDWNHYGVPRITEDNTDPLHPKVFVRYASAKNPDGTWAAFTSVPAGPILPTDGHQFTNPSVNFGGEHFGVGFIGTPTAVKYNWLKDDGAGNLVFAGAVNISTPTFTYIPPVNALPAQVQAVVVPPPPPAPPPLEFGDASWVKETRTSSHNNDRVLLRDLVSDDPNDPNDRNWMNNEAAEVEVEWQIFQTDFNAGNGGANGEIVGAPEDLNNGDEVITRRYDFFKYVGPIDPETGEALADTVGPDGIHGVGAYADVVVVGDYIGAQMAGFDAAGKLGLIDHLQDGEVNTAYVERTIVVGGAAPITTTRTGDLPDGMTFDVVTGVLSGTPTVSGTFTFTIHSIDANAVDVTATYTLLIAESGIVQPPQYSITTSATPAEGGSTTGDGLYDSGANVTVTATPNPGFAFVNWTDGGTIVGTLPSLDFTADVNRHLVANFVRTYVIATTASPAAAGTTSGDGVYNSGGMVTVLAKAKLGYRFVNWKENGVVVSTTASYTFTAGADRNLVANFMAVPIPHPIRLLTVTSPVIGGSDTPGSITLQAPAPPGGVTLTLTSSNPGVLAVPDSVFVPAGQKTVTFVATTYLVDIQTNVRVTADMEGYKRVCIVKVMPQ